MRFGQKPVHVRDFLVTLLYVVTKQTSQMIPFLQYTRMQLLNMNIVSNSTGACIHEPDLTDRSIFSKRCVAFDSTALETEYTHMTTTFAGVL